MMDRQRAGLRTLVCVRLAMFSDESLSHFSSADFSFKVLLLICNARHFQDISCCCGELWHWLAELCFSSAETCSRFSPLFVSKWKRETFQEIWTWSVFSYNGKETLVRTVDTAKVYFRSSDTEQYLLLCWKSWPPKPEQYCCVGKVDPQYSLHSFRDPFCGAASATAHHTH